jgi:large conductance mechanosensitive channel
MRKYIGEFRDFINKGDVITIAVGLVMALYFQKIVDAVLNGIINPIIAAIFGESNFTDIGFNIGDPPEPGQGAGGGNKDVSIGMVIDAVISFVAVAFFLFLVIKVYNRYRAQAPAGPPPADVVLLTEIRDELRASRAGGSLPPPPG